MKILFACGTDDGKTLTDEHFGSASFYMIFSMDGDEDVNLRVNFKGVAPISSRQKNQQGGWDATPYP